MAMLPHQWRDLQRDLRSHGVGIAVLLRKAHHLSQNCEQFLARGWCHRRKLRVLLELNEALTPP